MTKAQYQEAIKTARLPLTPSEKFAHFRVLYYPLVLLLMSVVTKLMNLADGIPLKFSLIETVIVLLIVIVVVLLYMLQKRRLSFHVIPVALCKQDLKQICNKVVKDLKWIGWFRGDACVVTIDRYVLTMSVSERVTIIVDEQRVLINSISDLNRRASILSLGRNAKNITTFGSRFQEYASEQIKAQSTAVKIEN